MGFLCDIDLVPCEHILRECTRKLVGVHVPLCLLTFVLQSDNVRGTELGYNVPFHIENLKCVRNRHLLEYILEIQHVDWELKTRTGLS